MPSSPAGHYYTVHLSLLLYQECWKRSGGDRPSVTRKPESACPQCQGQYSSVTHALPLQGFWRARAASSAGRVSGWIRAPGFSHLRRPAKVSSESGDEGCVLRAAEEAGSWGGGDNTEREVRWGVVPHIPLTCRGERRKGEFNPWSLFTSLVLYCSQCLSAAKLPALLSWAPLHIVIC